MEQTESIKQKPTGACFEIRDYCDEDYPEIEKWFKHLEKRGWMCPPESCLPKATGLVVEYEGRMVCASFLYLTNSAIASIEFTIANFEVDRELRKQGVTLLLTELIDLAIELDHKFIFSSTNNPGLARRFKELGFIRSDKVYNYIKVL